jgi:hypothetical protein
MEGSRLFETAGGQWKFAWISSKLRRSGQTVFKGLKEFGVGINRDLGRLRMVEPVE